MQALVGPDLLLGDEEDGGEEHQQSVTDVSEHDSEEERVGHRVEHPRVQLEVSRGSVRVVEALERLCELVGLDKRRRRQLRLQHVHHRRCRRPRPFHAALQSVAEGRERLDGDPALGDDCAVGDERVEQVHGHEDRLLLQHLPLLLPQTSRQLPQELRLPPLSRCGDSEVILDVALELAEEVRPLRQPLGHVVPMSLHGAAQLRDLVLDHPS
mmetsp:Transcript_16006/g.36552  ORF Transcript_16006/g.36552 Transcript_16006/m.36552 type:complete len:212 (-) Transcript_16006:748-1383(-)